MLLTERGNATRAFPYSAYRRIVIHRRQQLQKRAYTLRAAREVIGMAWRMTIRTTGNDTMITTCNTVEANAKGGSLADVQSIRVIFCPRLILIRNVT
jgi:hypothetical protein